MRLDSRSVSETSTCVPQAAPALKVCSKCGEAKSRGDFHRASRARDGRTAWCKPCRKTYQKAWCEAHREQVKATNRAWFVANPDKRADWYLRSQYGISLADYDGMLAKQGGRCAVCDGTETAVNKRTGEPRRLAVDHDHGCCPGRRSCGECIRGLLCDRCNRALGQAHDDLGLLVKLAGYLRRVG